jgi:carbamoylphosphate synthase large subunit
MKRKILILGGGTATTWHLSKLIKEKFFDSFHLCIADINEKKLIPASTLCDSYFQLPPIADPFYYDFMLKLFEEEKIDVVVPLIDFDLLFFPKDNPDLLRLNILSTAPNQETISLFKSKSASSDYLHAKHIRVPRIYQKSEIESETNYFVKPDKGFGSKDARVEKGKDIFFSDQFIVQEVLHRPEITVEIFKKDTIVKYICRERLDVKAGVSTKARFFDDKEIKGIIEQVSRFVDLPLASCVQFMKDTDNQWCLTDFNMRLGAGTALSSAAGFSIASAFLSVLAGKDNFIKHLKKIPKNSIVVRVYDEIVMP